MGAGLGIIFSSAVIESEFKIFSLFLGIILYTIGVLKCNKKKN